MPLLTPADAHAAPGLVVSTALDELEGTVRWSVANDGGEPVAVDRVRLRFDLTTSGTARMLRHGWQSWSPTGVGVIGEDVDESRAGEAPGLMRAMYHADDRPVDDGELRSELVTVVADDHEAVCVGFDGGHRHDGTIRVRPGEVIVEALLGGAVLAPGEERVLHDVRLLDGDPSEALERWASWAGGRSAARTGAPYQVGWCSWYQYFHGITEAALRANLDRAGEWPIDVFQLDDGYQAAIGDWLKQADTFPTPLDVLAADIAAAGHRPGLWLAPFLAAPSSRLAAEHPGWVVRRASGRPAVGMVSPAWGGEVHVLDTTHPEVLDHLEGLARTLVDMGWRYLKLDFTYAPSFTARWHDPSMTPAERVRAGYDAVRRGAGDDTFILGCGAPLGPCIGVVDGMRIGPDVAPFWAPPADGPYRFAAPSTENAWRNTLARSFLHRRLWLNDPDCLMLRTDDTHLSEEQVEAWALAVGASGGMAVMSDDLALLDSRARRLLDDVVAVGRAVDQRAITGAAPRCPDLLDRWTPQRLAAGPLQLHGDADAGRASLHRHAG